MKAWEPCKLVFEPDFDKILEAQKDTPYIYYCDREAFEFDCMVAQIETDSFISRMMEYKNEE